MPPPARPAWLAAAIAAAATLALLGLLWLGLHYGDKRIWLGLSLLMALSPLALVWRLARADRRQREREPD